MFLLRAFHYFFSRIVPSLAVRGIPDFPDLFPHVNVSLIFFPTSWFPFFLTTCEVLPSFQICLFFSSLVNKRFFWLPFHF